MYLSSDSFLLLMLSSASHSESWSISSVLEMLMHNVRHEVSVGLANFFLLKYSLWSEEKLIQVDP